MDREAKAKRMAELRHEQRARHFGAPVKRKRVVGKPSKQKRYQRKGRGGGDAFFHSVQGGSIG